MFLWLGACAAYVNQNEFTRYLQIRNLNKQQQIGENMSERFAKHFSKK